MADTQEGVTVVVQADVSQLTAATNQVNTFGNTLKSTMAGVSSAAASAGAATDSLTSSTSKLGSTISDVGGRRDITESLTVMQQAASGTGGAMDALRVGLEAFGTSLGGPVLIGITLAVGALGTLYEAVTNYNTEQKQLQETADALNLPVDQVKNMTQAMISLSQSIALANAGLGKLSPNQVNLLQAMGLDPTNVKSGQEALQMITTSTESTAQKINQIIMLGLASNATEAQKVLDAQEQQATQTVETFWQKMSSWVAAAGAAEGGDTQTASALDAGASQTQGSQWKQGGAMTAAQQVVTQQRIQASQQLQDTLTEIANKGSDARIDAMTNESQKIIAQAQIEAAGVLQAAQKQAQAYQQDNANNPSDPGGANGAAQIQLTAAQSAQQIMEAAQEKAQQERLQSAQQFQQQLATLEQDGASAAVAAYQSETQKILAEADAKTQSIADELQKDLQNQQLTDQQKVQLETAAQNSIIEVNQAAQEKIAQLQTTTQQSIQNKLNDITTAGAQGQIKTATDTISKLMDQWSDYYEKLENDYDQDLNNIQKDEDDGTITTQDAVNDRLTAYQKYIAARQELDTNYQTALKNSENQATQELITNWSDMTKQMDQATASTMSSMADAIGQFAATGKLDIQSLTQTIISDLVKIAAEKAIAGIAGDLFGGFTPSMDYGAAASSEAIADTQVTPMFAGGGTVQAGVPIVVGERGQELFTPNVGGTITNNSSIGGSNSTNFTVQIQNQGTPQKVQSATPTQTAQGLIIQIVTQDMQRNGPISQTMSNTYGLKRGG